MKISSIGVTDLYFCSKNKKKSHKETKAASRKNLTQRANLANTNKVETNKELREDTFCFQKQESPVSYYSYDNNSKLASKLLEKYYIDKEKVQYIDDNSLNYILSVDNKEDKRKIAIGLRVYNSLTLDEISNIQKTTAGKSYIRHLVCGFTEGKELEQFRLSLKQIGRNHHENICNRY